MTWKRRILIAIGIGIFLGSFSRTVHDIYVDYRSAKGLIAASGRPIGGDFVCFYVAGQAAAEDPSKLYDWEDARKRQRALLNAPDGKEWILPYAYPPPFALLLIPFSKLAFFPANFAWIGFSLFLALLSVFLVLSQSRFDRRQRFFASLSLLAFTPFTLDCLAGGQTSAIGMLIVAGVYYLIKKGRDFAAGLVFGLGYYKPPLFFFLALVFLLQRRLRILGGAFFSGLSLLLLSIIYLGPDGFMDYLEKMSRYLYGREIMPGIFLPARKAVGLLSFLISNLSFNIALAWIVFFIFLFSALLFYLRASSSFDPKTARNRLYDISYALGVSLSLLLSVQMLNYDISIFFIPILLVVEHLVRLQIKLGMLIGCAISFLFFFAPQLLGQVQFAYILINPTMLIMVLWVIYLFYLIKNEPLNNNTCL
jgi:hypothetical protein